MEKKETLLDEINGKDKKVRLSEEYLLIYVHFIERLIKRLDQRGNVL